LGYGKLFTYRQRIFSIKTGYSESSIYGKLKGEKVQTGFGKYTKWKIPLKESSRINKLLK